MKVTLTLTPDGIAEKSALSLIKTARPDMTVIGGEAMNALQLTTDLADAEHIVSAVLKLEKQLSEIKMVASCHKT